MTEQSVAMELLKTEGDESNDPGLIDNRDPESLLIMKEMYEMYDIEFKEYIPLDS
jgi:hypothetical protein